MDSTSTFIFVIALFVIMIGMGLSLTVNDFKRVLKYTRAVFIVFLNQKILLPGILIFLGNKEADGLALEVQIVK